jgi:hypothetical protein
MLLPWNCTTKLPYMHGGRGEALSGGGKMEEDMDKGNKKEAMDPMMVEKDQINKVMETTGKTRTREPYQYKMNNKKRDITNS